MKFSGHNNLAIFRLSSSQKTSDLKQKLKLGGKKVPSLTTWNESLTLAFINYAKADVKVFSSYLILHDIFTSGQIFFTGVYTRVVDIWGNCHTFHFNQKQDKKAYPEKDLLCFMKKNSYIMGQMLINHKLKKISCTLRRLLIRCRIRKLR